MFQAVMFQVFKYPKSKEFGMNSKKVQKNATIFFAILLIIPVLLTLSKPTAATPEPAVKPAYAVMDKNALTISLTAADPAIGTLSADPENKYELRIKVTDGKGAAAPFADVQLSVAGTAASVGSFDPLNGTTDADGCFTSYFIPPAALDLNSSGKWDAGKSAGTSDVNNTYGTVIAELKAKLAGTNKTSTLKIKLIPVPIVMVHGYQASPDIFSGLRVYLSAWGYSSTAFDYESEKGIASAAAELSNYLVKKSSELKAEGVQAKRFDLVTHSMGGLVARYYTCGEGCVSNNNIRKLIFISVPQKGSPFASLGLQYYSDDSIRDMATDSELMAGVFPSMINSGLNPSIETGNILDRFDEVVSIQNASLSEWKINTEIFDVGESNLTVDKLVNGEILKATNHKRILYNMKVYQRIVEMLGRQMPYPTSLSK